MTGTQPVAPPTRADAVHQVRLVTADGAEFQLDCPEEQTVVAAAEAAGMVLPSQCRQGSCGSCHARVSGEYLLGEHNPLVLTDHDRATGTSLLCRTRPRGPLTVRLPGDRSRIVFGTIPRREAELAAIEPVARDTVRLRLRLGPDPDGGTGLQCEPGQFLELSPPGSQVRRAYSLANTTNWDGVAELFIRLQPGGYFSSYLRDRARVGDRLVAHGPQGGFGLRETGLRPRWFVAGGTGLAPLLAMVRQMAEWGEPYPVRLFFGVNDVADVFAESPLRELARQLPRFDPQVVVWHPTRAWDGAVGTAAEVFGRALAGVAGDGAAPDVYVCGPVPLVEAVRQTARDHGLTGDHVIVERFTPAV